MKYTGYPTGLKLTTLKSNINLQRQSLIKCCRCADLIKKGTATEFRNYSIVQYIYTTNRDACTLQQYKFAENLIFNCQPLHRKPVSQCWFNIWSSVILRFPQIFPLLLGLLFRFCICWRAQFTEIRFHKHMLRRITLPMNEERRTWRICVWHQLRRRRAVGW